MSDLEAPQKNKVGKPTLYFDHVQPYLKDIAYWSEMGMMKKEIAEKLNISITVLSEYQNKYPEFKEALDSKWQETNKNILKALKTRAIGYTVEDEQETEEEYWAIDKKTKKPYRVLDEQGNPIKIIKKTVTKKHIPADSRSATFILTNRDRENWKATNSNNITVNNQNNNMNMQNNYNLSELSDIDLLAEIEKLKD